MPSVRRTGEGQSHDTRQSEALLSLLVVVCTRGGRTGVLLGLTITLTLGLPFAPLQADAQGKVKHIGYLSPGPPPGGGFHAIEPFREGLVDVGYVVGQSLVIHERYASGKDHLLADLAA